MLRLLCSAPDRVHFSCAGAVLFHPCTCSWCCHVLCSLTLLLCHLQSATATSSQLLVAALGCTYCQLLWQSGVV